jgi:methylated-DNA-[protein]-cysteine S-methyltransferase
MKTKVKAATKTEKVGDGERFKTATIKSPIGKLILVADSKALLGVYFDGMKHIPRSISEMKEDLKHPIMAKAAAQLGEYFDGSRKSFSLPLRFEGTEFQKKVWLEIARIPNGETIHYGELARRSGLPEAIRAAGTATGRNPIAIVVPCHRVVGKNGDLCGFAGGLAKKRFLLALEGARA